MSPKPCCDAYAWGVSMSKMVQVEQPEWKIAASNDQGASPRFARSRQMVSCLRNQLLYSEKRARDVLFRVIHGLLVERPDGGLMVTRLTREAARVAKQVSEQTGYEFSNWTAAASAVVKALLCSGSLLSSAGEPIAFGVSAHAAPAGSLRDDYEDRTEASLLEVLLLRLGDVTPRDHTALAHALFRQFDRNIPRENLEDRVAILLARLADRVVMEGDTYVVRDAGSAAAPFARTPLNRSYATEEMFHAPHAVGDNGRPDQAERVRDPAPLPLGVTAATT